jgi:hypothetical protein
MEWKKSVIFDYSTLEFFCFTIVLQDDLVEYQVAVIKGFI